jgi:twitching motility two-component system response regulator PilG
MKVEQKVANMTFSSTLHEIPENETFVAVTRGQSLTPEALRLPQSFLHSEQDISAYLEGPDVIAFGHEEEFVKQFNDEALLPQNVACPFCQAHNNQSKPRCGHCGAFIRLENFEQLFANYVNDEQSLRHFIETVQANTAAPSAAESFNLGLAFLNLRNVKKAVSNFKQVLRLNIDNEDWNAQITALFDYLNENMPEVMGNVTQGAGKTVMIVDDSPTIRKLIVGKLEKYGYRAIAAVDGMDALSKIKEDIPDLILLDVTIPRLDGYQLCKLIKKDLKTKHVPVVLISSKGGFFDKIRRRIVGSTAYITKPFGPEILIQTVNTYCSKTR